MSRIICFLGSDHRCGTSQIARCVSNQLAQENKKSNILLVNASMQYQEEYFPGVCESMERIRPYLLGKLFDEEEIIKKAKYKDNLYVIGGSQSAGSANSYNPDSVLYFLSKISEKFDYVVCDCGAEIDHGLCLGTLFCADMIFLTLCQSENSLRRLEWVRPLLNKLGIKPYKFILNKYSSSESYDLSYISKRLEIEKKDFCKLRISQKGKTAEINDRALNSFGKDGFSRDIKKLTEIIKNYE